MKSLIVSALVLSTASFAFGHCGACEGDKADHKHASAELKCSDGCCELIGGYEKVSAALAADDLKAAKKAADGLSCFAECNKDKALGDAVLAVANADSLDKARASFKAVSAAVIPLAKNAGDHYIMTCPMAGADWLQTSKDLANPYMGKAMLKCGGIKQTVTKS